MCQGTDDLCAQLGMMKGPTICGLQISLRHILPLKSTNALTLRPASFLRTSETPASPFPDLVRFFPAGVHQVNTFAHAYSVGRVCHITYIPSLEDPADEDHLAEGLNCHPSSIRRMILGKTLSEVLSSAGDSVIPVFLPLPIIDRCNELILGALKDHNIPASEPPITLALRPHLQLQWTELQGTGENNLVPSFWRINAICAWQLIDRRIDEYACARLCYSCEDETLTL